jgi:hypothetical protein
LSRDIAHLGINDGSFKLKSIENWYNQQPAPQTRLEKEKKEKRKKAELSGASCRHRDRRLENSTTLTTAMQDSELKKILIETCPIRPGQETRAWNTLRDRIYHAKPTLSPLAWLYYPTWRGALIGSTAVCALFFLANLLGVSLQPISYASANSEAPGIYATSFYSHSAKAQVVWLNGLDPATDQPTYLDQTGPSKKAPPADDPNSL